MLYFLRNVNELRHCLLTFRNMLQLQQKFYLEKSSNLINLKYYFILKTKYFFV